MPKEIVRSQSWGESDDQGTVRVEVGWSRERGDLHVATVADAPPVYELLEAARAVVAAVAGEQLQAAVAELAEAIEHIEAQERHGWFAWLDRSAVNALIRNLRRARDQAFGRDE